MRKLLKLSIAVFALAIICCMPVDAATVIQGDVTRDERIDICDLIRAKKYVSGKNITVDIKTLDFESKGWVNANDLNQMRNLLVATNFSLSEPTYPAGTTGMEYQTGLDENGHYNTTLYNMNGKDVEGADPGAFYDETSGYFYMYVTGSAAWGGDVLTDSYWTSRGISNLAYRCYRSKNLNQWELCGALPNGYAMQVKGTDWCKDCFWAPEVIKSKSDGKYYMYFSAMASATSTSDYDKIFLGVAVANAPTGPFTVINASGGGSPINFQTGKGLSYAWPAIDPSPFYDDDGTLYLYFNKHEASSNNGSKGVWGMKMTNMTTPNYGTLACLLKPGYTKVTSYSMSSSTGSGTLDITENGINEGPSMIKYNNYYYLTYSKEGYGSASYAVMQAISANPLSGFTKLSAAQGNPVIMGTEKGYMSGTGHHAIVKKGSELYAIYHRHLSKRGWDANPGRAICAERLTFARFSNNTVLVANGPSLALNWQGEQLSGYKNLTSTATVTANAWGAEYLYDNYLPSNTNSNLTWRRLSSDAEQLTITLSWSSPVSVNALMVYNGMNRANAFSRISEISFKFAETPSWAAAGTTHGMISNLVFPDRYIGNNASQYIPNAPAVAEFDTIKVTEIKLVINRADKIDTSTATIEIPEIVVLGGKTYNSKTDAVYGATQKNDDYMTIDGGLSEKEWSDKKWYEFSFPTASDGTVNMKITGFPTAKGVYIASVVEDQHMMDNGYCEPNVNSGWEFYVGASNVGETPAVPKMSGYRFMFDLNGDCNGVNNDVKAAVWTDGPFVNDATWKGTLEAFIPWSALDVDTSKGIPTEFGVTPFYLANDSSTGTTKSLRPKYYVWDDIRYFYRLNATGASEFTQAATIGGKMVYSNVVAWNTSQLAEGIVTGNNALCHLQPLYFSQTATDALLSTKIEYTTDTSGSGDYQEDLMGGFIFNDGNTTGYILAWRSGIRVVSGGPGGTWGGNAGLINTPVLMKTDKRPVVLSVARRGDMFYVYMDDACVMELKTKDVIPTMQTGYEELAMGLSMVSDKTADIKFSNIKYSPNSSAVEKYMNAPLGRGVLLGKILLRSQCNYWDVSRLDEGILIGSKKLNSSTKPIFYSKTSTVSLMSGTFEYTTSIKEGGDYQPDLFGGFVVDDGNTQGHIWANITGITIYNSAGKWQKKLNLIPASKEVLTMEDQRPVDMTVARYEDKFYVYFDGVHVTTLNITEVLPNATATSPIAMGVSMNADKTADIRISNIKFSTDESETKLFIENKIAKNAYVDGKVISSNQGAWDLTQIAQRIITGSTAMGSKLQPIYFTETGTKNLMSAKIEYTTDTSAGGTYQNDLFGGFVLSDGNNRSYIFANDTGITIVQKNINGDAWIFKRGLVANPVLMASDRRAVDMKVVRGDGNIEVYFDDVKIITMKQSEVLPYTAADAPIAMGISMSADQTADIKFSDILYYTNENEVDLALKTDFASKVLVNNNIVSSNWTSWNLSNAANNVVSISNSANAAEGKLKPLYFGKKATNFTVEFTAKYTTEIDPWLVEMDPNAYQNDLWAGFAFSNGTNRDFIFADDTGLVYTGWKFVRGLISQGVLMRDTQIPVDFKIVKQGDTISIYMNGTAVVQNGAWSTYCPNMPSDQPMAIGIMMNADYQCDLEISNYSLTVND